MTLKNTNNYWELDSTPTPLFTTTTMTGCCLKYYSTPDNVRDIWLKNKKQ
jgi:hypothetical protein